jgi:hypothetical protein
MSDACPSCGTSRQQYPSLKLLYSTCCGRVLCSTCVEKLPSRIGTQAAICPQCKQNCTNRDWSGETIESQYFNRESTIRKRLNKIFIPTKQDFVTVYKSEKGEMEYNNYTEFVADCVYDLLYGDKTDIENTEKRINEWKATNASLIEATQQRIVQEQKQQQAVANAAVLQKSKNAATSDDINMNISAAGGSKSSIPTSFTLPTMKVEKGYYVTKDDERAELQRIHGISDATEKQRELDKFYAEKRLREERARMAGGWRAEDDIQRSVDQALQCVFDMMT